MSLIKNMFGKFKKALKAAAYFIGYSIINAVSAAALVGGICGMYFTAVAISQLAIAPAAYLALETYILMRIGKRVGLKIVDFLLEKSGMAAHSYDRPQGEFLKVFKPSYKTADDESAFSSGFNFDISWSFGPFSISLPWAGYSKKVPLEFKDLKNYVRMGFNYLFNKSGLETRCKIIATQKDRDEIEEYLIGYKNDATDREIRDRSLINVLERRIDEHKKQIIQEKQQQKLAADTEKKRLDAEQRQKTRLSEEELLRLTKEKHAARLKTEQDTNARIWAMNTGYAQYKKQIINEEQSGDKPSSPYNKIGTQMVAPQYANAKPLEKAEHKKRRKTSSI